ncbi:MULTISPECIES: HNH endonuclease [unclassified Sutcliffiella]|uniref:HNH endonuclease n=1 Tax=unclassified Sutcliffiella TaxID=2837532 RepID=UPI0030CB9C99
MACPITIYKNGDEFFQAENIQQAAILFAEQFNSSKYKFYDYIERGYVYNIPYYSGMDEYRFVAPIDIATNRRRELEVSGHKNARRFWLIPANSNDYDVEGAFKYYDTLDWKRSYNYENGDVLFIYVSGSVRRIRFKVEVMEGLVQETNLTYDNAFWKDSEKYEKSLGYDRTRVRLVDEANTSDLSLSKLREYGLKGNIQGSMKLTGELSDYIASFFEQDLTKDFFPEEVPATLEEGKRKTINVNVYERNPIARKQCIDFYGVKCQICNIDFEDTYGEVGKDFIHVHHIIPLHEIQQDYTVNPREDLIPVCPNCHAMLHRKENGSYLSLKQLKDRLKSKNSTIVV